MSDSHTHQVTVPRGVLIGAGILVAITMTLVAIFRIADIQPIAGIPQPTSFEVVELRFEDRPNGAVAVYESRESGSDRLVHVVQPGAGGFIRGVLRSLTRARRASGIGPEQPFRLVRELNGKLLLEDPATGQRIYLQAFGPDNVESFRMILASRETRQ